MLPFRMLGRQLCTNAEACAYTEACTYTESNRRWCRASTRANFSTIVMYDYDNLCKGKMTDLFRDALLRRIQ